MTGGVSSEPPPAFPYYRDPVADGTIERSTEECAACGRARGFIVTTLAYGEDVPADARFCPWCIADGTAHQRFGATFNEVDLGAAEEATAEVSERTPGFLTWQEVGWPTHCHDVGVYLGQPSGDQLRSNPEALDALRADLAQWDWGRDDDYVRDFIDGLGGSQVAYLFECPRCATQLVRWDQD
jgi:uncharacterized protein CbrC (UPF0167 family)